jgi:hypothetical protein
MLTYYFEEKDIERELLFNFKETERKVRNHEDTVFFEGVKETCKWAMSPYEMDDAKEFLKLFDETVGFRIGGIIGNDGSNYEAFKLYYIDGLKSSEIMDRLHIERRWYDEKIAIARKSIAVFAFDLLVIYYRDKGVLQLPFGPHKDYSNPDNYRDCGFYKHFVELWEGTWEGEY